MGDTNISTTNHHHHHLPANIFTMQHRGYVVFLGLLSALLGDCIEKLDSANEKAASPLINCGCQCSSLTFRISSPPRGSPATPGLTRPVPPRPRDPLSAPCRLSTLPVTTPPTTITTTPTTTTSSPSPSSTARSRLENREKPRRGPLWPPRTKLISIPKKIFPANKKIPLLLWKTPLEWKILLIFCIRPS